MGEVITFTSGKGGVGKTTTTANVGVGLSLLDKKVVLVDTDIGLRNLDVVMGLENRILYNLVDILCGRCRMRQALIRDKRYPNLWIIPSSCAKPAGNQLSTEQMRDLLSDLREEFDYVLVDSPAGIDDGFSLATTYADRIVVVTTPQISAIHDADCVLNILKRGKCKNIQVLINCFRRQMVKDGNMLDVADIRDLLDAELLGVILEDENVIIAQNHGEPIMGKHSVAEQCYCNVARRISGEKLEIPNYTRRIGFFAKWFAAESAGKQV